MRRNAVRIQPSNIFHASRYLDGKLIDPACWLSSGEAIVTLSTGAGT